MRVLLLRLGLKINKKKLNPPSRTPNPIITHKELIGLCGGGITALSPASRVDDSLLTKVPSSLDVDLLGELGLELDLENLPLPGLVSILGEMLCLLSGVESASPIT